MGQKPIPDRRLTSSDGGPRFPSPALSDGRRMRPANTPQYPPEFPNCVTTHTDVYYTTIAGGYATVLPLKE